MILWSEHVYQPQPHGIKSRWCGEYWDNVEDTGAPWGVCWVAVYGDGAVPGFRAVLWMVLVEGRFRRRGIAKALIEDARERWPGIMITEGVSPAGEALYNSLPD